MYKIGVFDSGIGGLSIANAIKNALPGSDVVWVSDTKNVPYGDKPPAQVFEFVLPLLKNLEQQNCDAIVIACNTVTTNHIAELRKHISVPMVGIEPMVKPAAAATKSGVIAVCATPATLTSERYKYLKQEYAKGLTVLEPDCSNWAYMIEQNQINDQAIQQTIDELCDKGADVIVLGCTHYHWIEKRINAAAHGRAQVIQPTNAIIAQLKRVLETT